MSENSAPRKLSRGKIALIAAVVAIVIIAVAVYLLTADSRAYSRGVELQEAGAYSEAIAVLETIPDYEDARERISACSYQIALDKEAAGSYAEAQAAFAALGDYLDAAERAEEAGYRQGVLLEETGSAQEAAAAFEALGSYKDSAARAANLQSALERYAAELERVQGQTEALETALAAGEVLLSEDRAPLDEATRTELQAALEAGAAASVELPAEPNTLTEVEDAADALAKIDCAALAERAQAAVEAYTDSTARYALVDGPTAEFVIDRLSRVPEIANVVLAGAQDDAGNAEPEEVVEDAPEGVVNDALEEAVDDTASGEVAEDVTADDATSEEVAADVTADDAAPEDVVEDVAAEDAAPEEVADDIVAEDAAPDEVAEDVEAEDAAPEEVVEDVAAEDAAPEEVAEDAAPEEVVDNAEAEDAAPEKAEEDVPTAEDVPAADGEPDANAPTARVYFASTLVSEACIYLSDEDLRASDGACGGCVEFYATAEAAQRRDGELASQGGGAHAAAGTLVVRLSDVLSAQERQALMAKVLDALTTSEPGETVERAEQTQSLSELLTVRETGFAVEDGRLYYALVLANDMADTTVEFPRVRVSFYDEAGELIAADESVRLAICPGQELTWASDIWHIDETPASVEAEVVTPRSRDFVNDVTLCAPLEVRAATIDQSGDAATLTCEIYNPNSFEAPSAYVTILYRDSEGALLSGENAACGPIPAGESIQFETPLVAGLVQDTFEVFASLG